MNLQEKQQITSDFNQQLAAAQIAFVINYQGCTCEELTGLRKKLKPVGGQFAVVKNTIAKRAVTGTDTEGLKDFFRGPSAIVWSKSDAVGSAKVLTDYAKENEKFTVKAGVMEGAVLDAKQVADLANMPSKEQLVAKLLALLNAPATRLLQTLNAPASSLARLVRAWQDELEKRGS